MSSPAIYRFNRAARFFAIGGAAIALIGFAGYLFGKSALVTGGTNLAGMSPVTAACLLGLSIALMASTYRSARLQWIALALTCGASLAMLANRAIEGTDTISPAIGQIIFHTPPAFTGRMSLATALAVTSIAISLAAARQSRLAADICSGTAATIAVTALIGYAFNVADLYSMPLFSTMAVNTALALACLSTGALLFQPFDQDSARKRLPRWSKANVVQVCGVMAIPVLTSWLLLSTVSLSLLSNLSIALLTLLSASLPAALFVVRDARLRDAELGAGHTPWPSAE